MLSRVFVVESGLVMLSFATAHGDEQPCGVRAEGSFIGHEAILGQPARFDARLLVPSVLRVADVDAFGRWLAEAPEAQAATLRAVCVESSKLALERTFICGSTIQRLGRFLVGRETNPLLSSWQRAPRRVLAGLLSMRPETLSRALRTLHDEGLIEDGPEIEVRDLDGLAQKVGESL